MTRLSGPSTPRTPRPRSWLLAALLVAALVVALGAAWWLRGRAALPAPPVTTVVPEADGTPLVAPLPVTGLFVEPGDGRAPLLDEIAAARRSIDLEVYILSDEVLLHALEEARGRGVAVRVILEEHPFGGGGGQDATFARLEAAGIDVRWGNPVFRFSHIKTMIVDDAVAVIMNLNLTASAFSANRELGVVTTRPDAVRTAAAIFAADWSRGAETDPGPLVVSPTNAREQLLALVDGARVSLDLYAEVLRDPELIAALAAAAERGVRVRLVMSPSPDFTEELATLAAAGVEARLATDLYIHAKAIAVDGERAFVGSQNLSATSLDQNRELGIVVDDPLSLARLEHTFALDFRAATPWEE
jgi:phosphatidylserine/phosphatidylglycerophosphate/cardiolipin synthase-like enzyme